MVGIEGEPRVAFLYAGQGSQYVGMGKDVYNRSPLAQRIFGAANQILGYSLEELCFDDPGGRLIGKGADTSYIQPALYITQVATRVHLQTELGFPNPVLHLGHSLGKLAALEGSGALDFIGGLRISIERGNLMQEAVRTIGTGVGLISGGPAAEVIEQRINALGNAAKDVKITVINTVNPNQFLVGGPLEQVRLLLAQVEAKRKEIYEDAPLSHHPIMQKAQDGLNRLIDNLKAEVERKAELFSKPLVPVIDDVRGVLIHSEREAEQSLREHIIRPLLWNKTITLMKEQGVRLGVEIGPGRILQGFMRRNYRECVVYVTSTGDDITQLSTRFGLQRFG